MENPTTFTNGNLQKGSVHSEICSVTECDFDYRKSYQGDWGHWDDLPETINSSADCMEIEEEL